MNEENLQRKIPLPSRQLYQLPRKKILWMKVRRRLCHAYKKVGKLFYKKGRISNFQRTRPQMKNEIKKEEMDPYFLQEDGTFDSGLSLSPSDHI